MLVAISTNHSKIIIWLRSIISHIQNTCHLTPVTNSPTIIYDDNVACITQVRGGYIKGDKTKHILTKKFYIHELQKSRQVDIKQIRSNNNLVDLFTKSLSTSSFEKLVYGISIRQVNKL